MPSVGPSLPPHLQKRTREGDDEPRSSSPESSEKRRRVLGPALPPTTSTTSKSHFSSPESDIGPAPPLTTGPAKPTRVLGPAPPPAPLSERPPNPPSDSDSDSSDDDFGPARPPAGAQYTSHDDDNPANIGPSAFDTAQKWEEANKKPQRDEWMTLPPTQDDLAARLDPTKVRPGKFKSTKPGRPLASGHGAEGMGVWTETPAEKLKRLQNEALGISAPANSTPSSHSGEKSSRRTREEEEKAEKIRRGLAKERGKSLMDQHKEKGEGKEKEDDPSKRGFDWEKDMSSGMKIDSKKREDLLKRARGFGERFSSGSFL